MEINPKALAAMELIYDSGLPLSEVLLNVADDLKRRASTPENANRSPASAPALHSIQSLSPFAHVFARLVPGKNPMPHLPRLQKFLDAAFASADLPNEVFHTRAELIRFVEAALPVFTHTILGKDLASNDSEWAVNEFLQSVIRLCVHFFALPPRGADSSAPEPVSALDHTEGETEQLPQRIEGIRFRDDVDESTLLVLAKLLLKIFTSHHDFYRENGTDDGVRIRHLCFFVPFDISLAP